MLLNETLSALNFSISTVGFEMLALTSPLLLERLQLLPRLHISKDFLPFLALFGRAKVVF